MSGGVDSAVAAARCVAAGHDVDRHLAAAGARRRRAAAARSTTSSTRARSPTGSASRTTCSTSATRSSAPWCEPFVAEYLAGRTPNPCARCNQHVKFDLLWERARELGASDLATGHYARIATRRGDRPPGAAGRASTPTKDQSYFLFALDHAALGRTLFPVGELTKTEVRAEARALGLPVADKPDSMEVCFVPRRRRGGVRRARTRRRRALRPGRDRRRRRRGARRARRRAPLHGRPAARPRRRRRPAALRARASTPRPAP